MRKIVLFIFAAVFICGAARADSLMKKLTNLRPDVLRQPVEEWRFAEEDITNAEQPNFDDSSWRVVSPRFSWRGETNKVWFRKTITIPAEVAGQSTVGYPIRLELDLSNHCEVYVNGELREDFRPVEGNWVLTAHAQPGQSFCVALRVDGRRQNLFRYARLYCDALPDFDCYQDDLTFVTGLIKEMPADQQAVLKQALEASEQCVQFDKVTPGNLAEAQAQLAKARAALLPVADITRKYDVYYIGHSHIDMNWLWTWPETIDTCRRTWNSAMNLMDQFPQFQYVQSQPGAYVPIEEKYPDEFARMQKMSAEGRWNIVGGMWNESDTDIPSGEGLARSFLLGQEYFKAKFGRYAVTGWLPDSFGHTWQLPQIMQLAGEKYFYHMRCGNGMELTWWQSPDGSRVLTANTSNYDARPEIEQLLVPMENETRFNLPKSVVIFGVGDHGGGPTREQILRIESWQQDPIFPRVHFISADDFFNMLAQQPTAASLPVVDNDLQYTFTGCYTTHADMKKALRSGEDNLYSAEVLSSLAAMTGQPYPLAAFQDAWKPTTFAQFHDIAAGSAIHSTYDWMHDQLAPAVKFEKQQTAKSLKALTAQADTRGPGTTPIVVWNTLSFERSDVVKVAIPHAGQYHSVLLDNAGGISPAQALDSNTLVFVARVPAFGHRVYFPSVNSIADGINDVTVRDEGDSYDLQSFAVDLQINKTTGAISRLYSRLAHWNVFGDAQDANALELMGDDGSAWLIRYTDNDNIFTTEGATVSVLDQGPVFARVRVTHAYHKSTYTQDVIVYGALDRVDIPTKVNWQESGQLLKIRLPVNAAHVEVNAQIPYGSKERPDNGQECPGQKWMDVSETTPLAVHDATPLDLSALFNAFCASNFDGAGAGYPASRLPEAGIHQLGAYEVPFNLPGYPPDKLDNVAASGQTIPIPAGAQGNTLYLLAARSKGIDGTAVGFQFADGRTEFRAFELNNWKEGTYPNEAGFSFGKPHEESLSSGKAQTRKGKRRVSTSPTMWITEVPIPAGATEVVLPNDPDFHLFAATIASAPEAPATHGLSVLNDCKYGFDVTGNLFRLTALRSSDKPDAKPDKGMQEWTYSLYPHAGSWAAAHTDERALGLNIPLLAVVTTPHAPAGQIPSISVENLGGQGDLIVTALKRAEDGNGYILRFYEADGQDTQARIDFDQPMRVEETDILERPLPDQSLSTDGNSVTLPVGHNKIVTLRFTAGG